MSGEGALKIMIALCLKVNCLNSLRIMVQCISTAGSSIVIRILPPLGNISVRMVAASSMLFFGVT